MLNSGTNHLVSFSFRVPQVGHSDGGYITLCYSLCHTITSAEKNQYIYLTINNLKK